MARQSLDKSQAIGGGWTITLTDLNIATGYIAAWFAAGRGDGPFYVYNPHNKDDKIAEVIFEPHWIERNGQWEFQPGPTSYFAVPGSGMNGPNESEMLQETKLEIEELYEIMTQMVDESLKGVYVLSQH